MKKSILLLLAALLLPMAMNAQLVTKHNKIALPGIMPVSTSTASLASPASLPLPENQMLMGHYTTDSLTLGGCWGSTILYGVTPIATDLTPDELSIFKGGKIVAFRVGLSMSTPVTRVFVIPIDPNGILGAEIAWNCEVSDEGWNIVELETPYDLNLPDGYSLRIGFDYEQQKQTKHKPISAVKLGDQIYPTYCWRNNQWKDYGTNTKGNLSLQCIVENDNFPAYMIRVRNVLTYPMVKVGTDLEFSFQTCNLGTGMVAADGCTYEVSIDGNVITTLTNNIDLTTTYQSLYGSVSTTGLEDGVHTLTLTPVSVNGEAIEDPMSASTTFKTFTYGFERQMRLVEQFTSTYCTWCPLGSSCLQALSDLRGDIAWVGVHQNMSGTDPFRTAQCDSIASYEHCTGYPEGSFDRYEGVESAGEVCGVLSYNSAQYGASVFNSFLNSVSETPSWATVNINSTYDAGTRKAVITIDGDLVPNYEDMMGIDSRLTVYITEDGLVADQLNQGSWVSGYVHNGVLRKALVTVKGVALKKEGNTYKNEFTVDIPTAWKPENLNIVAFISRPLRPNALTDLYVTNANKRKLGEYDEPVEVNPGELNGDGIITIEDVVMLIDYVLTGLPSEIMNVNNADINGDSSIDINDVTLLIDYVLNGTW